jgi:hypothetical protein
VKLSPLSVDEISVADSYDVNTTSDLTIPHISQKSKPVELSPNERCGRCIHVCVTEARASRPRGETRSVITGRGDVNDDKAEQNEAKRLDVYMLTHCEPTKWKSKRRRQVEA